MAGFQNTPRFLLRLIHLPPRLAYVVGLGPLIGRFILLLTTRGRRSGRRRVTPLQYEEINDVIYIGAALGLQADWVCNIQAHPQVEIRIGRRRFASQAEIIRDPGRIANYLQIRLQRHPRMVAAILRSEGLNLPPTRQELEHYASQLVLVVIPVHS